MTPLGSQPVPEASFRLDCKSKSIHAYDKKETTKMLEETEYRGVGREIQQNDDLPTAQAAGDTIDQASKEPRDG